MAVYLVPLDAGLCVIPLEKAILLIGRQSDCDVSLTASRKISRKHCCIAIVNDKIIVRDLGSTNGVQINGNRINQEAQLRLGDELTIGDLRFRLQKEASLVYQTPVVPVPSPKVPTASDRTPPPISRDFPVVLEEGPLASSPLRGASAATPPSEYELVDSGPIVPYQTAGGDYIPLRSDSI